jgi:hypothetical protein
MHPIDPVLTALIDHASEFVEKRFRDVGRIEPIWIAVDQNGDQVAVPTPIPFVNPAAKDHATRIVRAMFVLTGVTRYVFVCESWILLSDDVPIDVESVQRDGIADHPARREVVNMIAESELCGLVMAWRLIIRPPKGKARLGPLVVEQRDGLTVEGRMSSMLPRKGRAS